MATHSFENKMEHFILSIQGTVLSSDKEQTFIDFRKEVIRYILKIQKGMGSTAIKSLAHRHNFSSEWSGFKQQYLDMSAYVNRKLWKAISKFVKEMQINDDSVLASDAAYCLGFLDMDDIEKLNNKTLNDDCNVDDIDLNSFTTGKRKKRTLPQYFKSKVGSLKFLVEYDPAMELEDFQQDLAVEYCRVFNCYEQSAGTKLKKENENAVPKRVRFMKYGETSLNNKVLNLKEHWSCESRRRVSTTDNKLYRLKSRLKKELTKNASDTKMCIEQKEKLHEKIKGELAEVDAKIKSSNGDFFSTITPLVRGSDGEFRELDAMELGSPLTESVDPILDVEDTLWVEEMILGLPPKLSNFVSVLLNYDAKFEMWFLDWAKDKKTKYDSNNINHRIAGVFEYCGVTRNELKKSDKLLKFVSRKTKGTWDHFFKQKGRVDNQIVVKNHDAGETIRAYLEDERDDGTYIFSVTDPRFRGEYDTAHDCEWSVVHRFGTI